jgi:hypothetical protein
MRPDPGTEAAILQQIVNAIVPHVDHVDYDQGGPILVVQDGFWFKLTPETLDNGEPDDEREICSQCWDQQCEGCVPFDTPSLDTVNRG